LASLGGLTGITPRARRRYVDSVREWHARHPVDAFIFYDASATIRAAIALGRPFLSFRSLVARDRRHALELLEEERARHRRAHLGRSWLRRLALRRYRRATVPVDVLLEYLGGIDWSKDGKPEIDAPTRFPRAHEVFDAIDLIKQDLDQTLREREAAREEARRGQQFLRAALERLPEGVVLLDDSGHVALANPTAEELLPLVSTSPADEPVRTIGDRPVDDYLSEAGEKRWHELVLEGPPRRILEIAGRELEGGARVLVMWDMTRERTVQRQLQQQERLAAVGQLAAGIAHDFNNILQGILLSAYQLAEHDDEEVAQSGTVVGRQAERGARLIRQILDFGRRSVSRRQPLDLAALLDDLVPLLSRTIPETVKIVVESSGGPHWISGDTAQLEQLVTNLTLNARDAMPAGGQLSLSLRSRRFESLEQVPETGMRAGDWVELVVRDTGVGIESEVLERIFEPFFSTKSPTEGTGLGLAQVYGIVRQHDAYVSCASRVGEGTTFHFYFPRIECPAETSGIEAGAKSSGQAGHHILVVEDDRMIRRLVAETLQSQGHDVVTASSGEEALAIVDETARPFSLVLTDVVMPDLGGVALCRELRQRSSETRLLVMSGYPLGQDLAELRALGVGGWLEKPFSMQALTDKVNELLGRPPARRGMRNAAIRD
ncbi:MAG: response regulator, partial [Thermoanaerobaculia bacterium]|nr:response regulator [Thermoanaerobaculia bacterium]